MQGDARVLRITYISKLFHFLKIGSIGRKQENTTAKWRGGAITQEHMSSEKITERPEWTLGKNARGSVRRLKPASTGCGCGTQRGTFTRVLLLPVNISKKSLPCMTYDFISVSITFFVHRLQENQERPNYSVRTKVL